MSRWEKWRQIALPTAQVLNTAFFPSEELQQHDDGDLGLQLLLSDDGFDVQQ